MGYVKGNLWMKLLTQWVYFSVAETSNKSELAGTNGIVRTLSEAIFLMKNWNFILKSLRWKVG